MALANGLSTSRGYLTLLLGFPLPLTSVSFVRLAHSLASPYGCSLALIPLEQGLVRADAGSQDALAWILSGILA